MGGTTFNKDVLLIYAVNCRKCGRRNHFAKVCQSKTQARPPQVQELNQDESSEDDMLIATVEGKNKKDWNVIVKINTHNTRFKIDTGAQCNVISKTYHQLSQQHTALNPDSSHSEDTDSTPLAGPLCCANTKASTGQLTPRSLTTCLTYSASTPA